MAEEDRKKSAASHQSKALSLYQLIGAPLQALIEAETQSAQATAAFIREFGFESGKDGEGEDDFGKLRMASFRQERINPDGKPSRVRVDVPLLSLLPVPALQIKDAQLEFFVKIVDIEHGLQRGVRGHQEKGLPDLHPIDFKAAMARDPSATGGRSLEMQMKVKINVQQADMPAGLARLFNLMEQGISAREDPQGE